MSQLLNNKRLGKSVGMWIANECINPDKMRNQRKNSTLKKLIKKDRKLQKKIQMIRVYGAARYYLAFWFGQWILYTGRKTQQPIINDTPAEKPYYKFYRDEKIANGYAKRLHGKYNNIIVMKVYDEHRNPVGYVLNASEKI